MDVELGDVLQVWLDFPGYQGRIGTVVKKDRKFDYLQLGDGVVVKLHLTSRTARIPGNGRRHPLMFKLCKHMHPQSKPKMRRTKQPTKQPEQKNKMRRTKFNRFKRTRSV